MLTYWRELTVTWGECDPFGLVYYPHMLAWFNDTEHACLRALGEPIDAMIARDRTTFVMGEVAFRFTGPVRYGQRVLSVVRLERIGRSTLEWATRCVHVDDGAAIAHGRATRVYARINADDTLSATPVGDALRALLEAATPPLPPLPPHLVTALDW